MFCKVFARFGAAFFTYITLCKGWREEAVPAAVKACVINESLGSGYANCPALGFLLGYLKLTNLSIRNGVGCVCSN